MKSVSNKQKASILLIATLVLSLGLYVYSRNSSWQNNALTGNGQGLDLVHPAFGASVASSTTFLENEAGISLYVNVGQSLNLSQLQLTSAPFRTIESKTSDYAIAIGSIEIPTNPTGTLPDTEDAHFFVHESGWIVVYYLNSEPISKIIDWSWWNGINLTSNKLQAGLAEIAGLLGVGTTGEQYYDFAHPSANKFMFIIKAQRGWPTAQSFNITLPATGFTFLEESWSCYAQNTGEADFYLDQPQQAEHHYELGSASPAQANYPYGTEYQNLLPLLDLAPNVVSVSYSDTKGAASIDGVCLVLAYQEG